MELYRHIICIRLKKLLILLHFRKYQELRNFTDRAEFWQLFRLFTKINFACFISYISILFSLTIKFLEGEGKLKKQKIKLNYSLLPYCYIVYFLWFLIILL